MKPILSDKQMDDIYFRLADGEPLDNETAKALFKDNCHYSGELLKLQTENRRRREERYAY